jgi:hypothetical protein
LSDIDRTHGAPLRWVKQPNEGGEERTSLQH